MNSKLFNAVMFTFAFSLPFWAVACWKHGWMMATTIFGLLYIGFALAIVLSVIVTKEKDEK